MNDTTTQRGALRRQWLTLSVQQRRYRVALVALVFIVLLLALLGDAARVSLRYERDAIVTQHAYWRLLTGHLVHGSWQHTWLNLAGLALMVALFHRTYAPQQWLLIGLATIVSIDLGMLCLMPQLQWYVGLSGVLHGVLAAGAVAWWRTETRLLAAVLTTILLAKLSWEQVHGALPLSGELNVIVNAHLYGAIGGTLMGLALFKCLPSGKSS